MKQISSALNNKEYELFQEMLNHKGIKMYAFLKSYVLEEIKKYQFEKENNL
jgi:hypothetical protein